MKKVVLLGTSHPIQRGDEQKETFTSYVKELSNTHNINAIAEEIDDKYISIAQNIAKQLNIRYIIIEPTQLEIKELNIEEVHRIVYELTNRFNIENWDNEYKKNTLPDKVLTEYNNRIQDTYRQREAEWLKRINNLNVWSTLVICGSSHYEPFYELLMSSGIDVIKVKNKWEGSSDRVIVKK